MLTERGHDVAFAGRPEMISRVRRSGFRAIELTRAYEQANRYPPDKWLPRAASYLTSPAVAEQIREVLASENPGAVVVDQMFPVALLEAARFGRPSVAVCHTCVWRGLDTWRKFFVMLAVGMSPPRGDADPASMRAAVEQVLQAGEIRKRAQDLSRALASVDGAAGGERVLKMADKACRAT